MHDGKEFGRRRAVETPAPVERQVERNFKKDRPMYERLHDGELRSLLNEWDALSAFQGSGHGVSDDAKAKNLLEERIEARFKKLTSGN